MHAPTSRPLFLRATIATLTATLLAFGGLVVAAPVAATEQPVDVSSEVLETAVSESESVEAEALEPVAEVAAEPLGDVAELGDAVAAAPRATSFALPFAAAAAAVEPTVSVSKTSGLNAAGETVTVTGTGFSPEAHPSVVGARPPLAGQFAGAYVAFGSYLDVWKPSAGAPSTARVNSGTKWVVKPEQVALVGGAVAGAVAVNSDGSFSVELTVKEFDAALAAGNYGIYTYAGSGATYAPFETYTPIEFGTPAVVAPSVSVSKTSGLNAAGETVTVTGTGFSPEAHPSVVGARPPLAGQFAGAYVAFGSYLDVWKPSAGAPSTARVNSGTKWVVKPEQVALVGGAVAGAVAVNSDGSFSVELTVKEFDAALAAGNYGIYTYAGSGATYAPFETYTPIEFGTPAVVAPSVSVSKTSGLNAAGETVTVTGTGFSPEAHPSVIGARPPLQGQFAGAYVAFGSYLDVWKPSADAPSSARVNEASSTKWVLKPEQVAAVGGANAGAVALKSDGSFSIELTVKEFDAALAAGNYGIYTYAGSGAKYAPFETYTPIKFGGAEPETPAPGPNPPVTPPTTPTPAPAPVSSGSLVWGIKAAFRDYVTSPIAHGRIAVSGASASGGAFVFGQASAGSYNAETGVGAAPYSGTVRFTGHNGALDVAFANPVVEVVTPQRGNLTMTVNGAQVHLATLNLAGAARSVVGGAVTYSGIPATLTAAGANAFSGFYAAGSALDPLTVTFGAPSTATVGSAVVASAAVTPPARTAASTPPATTGITIAQDGPLVPGGTVTITADGFQPNETGILVVIYSEPTVLDRNATADANGRVTWTGTLPAGLTGEHTLTLQGSVNRGIVVTIEEVMRIARSSATCDVTTAQLTWGFKEAFRAYISGTIANGEWTVADGAAYETPDFSWSDGTGTYDPADGAGSLEFAGSIRFTGHGGILDTTVANPRIEFIDETSARLFLDVSGTTQDGEAVEQIGVHFADLDLAAATVENDDGVTTITGAPAVLTSTGSAAFGTYETGTELDPVSVVVTVGDGCGEVVLEASADAEDVIPVAAEESSVIVWVPWLIAGLLLLVVLALAVFLLRRRAVLSADRK